MPGSASSLTRLVLRAASDSAPLSHPRLLNSSRLSPLSRHFSSLPPRNPSRAAPTPPLGLAAATAVYSPSASLQITPPGLGGAAAAAFNRLVALFSAGGTPPRAPKGFEAFEKTRKAGEPWSGPEDPKGSPPPPPPQPPKPGRTPGDPESYVPPGLPLFLLVLAYVLSVIFRDGNKAPPAKETSFKTFAWRCLAKGDVERLEVVNNEVVRVYLKPGAKPGSAGIGADDDSSPIGRDATAVLDEERKRHEETRADAHESLKVHEAASGPLDALPEVQSGPAQSGGSSPVYFFRIGSLEAFEQGLKDVYEYIGTHPNDYVPVSYVSEVDYTLEAMRIVPTLLIMGMGFFMVRGMMSGMPGGGGGRNIFQVGKANPIIQKAGAEGSSTTKFRDVAGLDEAKVEVMEFVDFLKKPQRYQELGAKIPKGALLVGPPGTGKTLLAKATAGEANVPFFSMSGSDFIEMFVGVGPSRVRDLFSQARQAAPCIIFIDEIDAVGRARGRGGMGGGNDERENTLNALLVEMDGFSANSGVVVLAGTNRADILDKALLRPGRFDRQISIDKPDIRGRYQIFKVHLAGLKLRDDADAIAKKVASLTPGFVGADIANICNEAALIAARHKQDSIGLEHFEAAADRVIAGLEKKDKVISRKEKEIVAHHEAGHAVAGWFLRHSHPLLKVTIVPHGSAALGFAQYLPEDRYNESMHALQDFICMALGGRVAEQLIFGRVTTGAQDDLKRASKTAYAMVSQCGMSKAIGPLNFQSDDPFNKPYSEKTAKLIDSEARKIVDDAYERCEKLLTEKLDLLKALAQRLLEKETVREDDLVDVLGPRPHGKLTDYDTFVQRYEEDRLRRMKQEKNEEERYKTKDDETKSPDGAKKKKQDPPSDPDYIPELC